MKRADWKKSRERQIEEAHYFWRISWYRADSRTRYKIRGRFIGAARAAFELRPDLRETA